MRNICAWCGKETVEGSSSGEGNGAGPVSHGICLSCADKLFANEAVSLQTIIDKFTIPILVMDSAVTVSILNKKAQEVLGTSLGQAEQRRGGQLFDCVYSHLPGGCGRTIHCAGCALRRAITATHETGEPQVSIPASLRRNDPDDPASVTLTITTIKRDDLIMVKLDKVE